MKVKVTKGLLIEGIRKVQGIAGEKNGLPVLRNVAIEATNENGAGKVVMTTTNLDITARTEIECAVEDAGATTIPVKLLVAAVSKCADGDITIDTDNLEKSVVKAGSAVFKIQGIAFEEFPKMQQITDCTRIEMEQEKMRDMIRKTIYARSGDQTRRTLEGVLFKFDKGTLQVVATDGRRLAMTESECNTNIEREIIIPPMAATELLKNLGEGTVELSASDSRLEVKMPKFTLFMRLLDDAYPNFKQVIPKGNDIIIPIDRSLFVALVGRASVMTMDEAHSTKLTFSDGMLTVSSAASDVGEARDEMPVKYSGQALEILFNPNYIMDAMNAVDDDELNLCLKDGHSPAMFKNDTGFTYVLMPLRIN